jgi:hypothetical protein
MVINGEWEPLFFFKGSDSGLLCKTFPLLMLDNNVIIAENNINLTTYDE